MNHNYFTPRDVERLEAQATVLRQDIIESIHAAGAGHPGGALSAADMITALYFHVLNIDPENPRWPDRDRFILSKGHACPALYAALARRGYFPGFDLAVFDYPGYGRAPGRPTEPSLLRMALAAFDRLRDRYDTVCVLGYSIGTGPANYVAANRPVAALALMAPYADGYDLYNSALDIFHGPLTRLLVSFKMESRLWARRVTVTPLLLASPRDRTVPFASSQALAECYPRAEFRPVEVADHAAFWQNEECLRLIAAYFTEAVS